MERCARRHANALYNAGARPYRRHRVTLKTLFDARRQWTQSLPFLRWLSASGHTP